MVDLSVRRSSRRRAGVQEQLRTLIRRAERLVEGLDRATLNRAPADGGWSVAECLDHLNETAALYLPALAETIENARGAGQYPGSRDRTLLGRLMAWTQEPPVRFRMKTFDAIRPARALDPGAVLDRFVTLHGTLIDRADESADLDGRTVKMRSELIPWLRLSLSDWLHFLAAHARRHLWQAEQVLAGLDASGTDE